MYRTIAKPFFTCLATIACACAILLGAGSAFADEQATMPEPAPMMQETSLEERTTVSDEPVVTKGVSQEATNELASNNEAAACAPDPARQAANEDASCTEEPLVAMGTINTVDMYRMYNPNSGEHFYTGSFDERASLINAGWRFEGIGWVAPEYSKSPVYRLYNANAGDHHYTLSTFERDQLIDEGWSDEGIGWYSDDSERIAVLRQYNPNAEAGAHNFTTSSDEDVALVDAGWNAEGVAWYAIAEGNNAFNLSYIYLDAGHGMGSSIKGSYDPGASGNGYKEAKLTEELVELTAQYARELYGLKVYSNVDTNVEYFNRQEDAEERGCTSLVSIHFNASDSGGTGTESYIHSRHPAAGAEELQEIMHEHLVDALGLRDRGMKSAALAVCSGYATDIPGVLLEICFIDNSYDMKKYQQKKDAVARELAAGLFEAAQNGF